MLVHTSGNFVRGVLALQTGETRICSSPRGMMSFWDTITFRPAFTFFIVYSLLCFERGDVWSELRRLSGSDTFLSPPSYEKVKPLAIPLSLCRKHCPRRKVFIWCHTRSIANKYPDCLRIERRTIIELTSCLVVPTRQDQKHRPVPPPGRKGRGRPGWKRTRDLTGPRPSDHPCRIL